MDPKKLIILAFLLSGLCPAGIHAQHVVAAAGGIITGSGGNVSYTAGQIIYASISGIGGNVNNNIQLPFEILIGTGINEARNISLEFSVYPNPVTEFLLLKVEDFDVTNLSYRLYGINGKLLISQRLNSKEISIPMGNLPAATYFLKIIYRQASARSEKEIKTFKIIKN